MNDTQATGRVLALLLTAILKPGSQYIVHDASRPEIFFFFFTRLRRVGTQTELGFLFLSGASESIKKIM